MNILLKISKYRLWFPRWFSFVDQCHRTASSRFFVPSYDLVWRETSWNDRSKPMWFEFLNLIYLFVFLLIHSVVFDFIPQSNQYSNENSTAFRNLLLLIYLWMKHLLDRRSSIKMKTWWKNIFIFITYFVKLYRTLHLSPWQRILKKKIFG